MGRDDLGGKGLQRAPGQGYYFKGPHREQREQGVVELDDLEKKPWVPSAGLRRKMGSPIEELSM